MAFLKKTVFGFIVFTTCFFCNINIEASNATSCYSSSDSCRDQLSTRAIPLQDVRAPSYSQPDLLKKDRNVGSEIHICGDQCSFSQQSSTEETVDTNHMVPVQSDQLQPCLIENFQYVDTTSSTFSGRLSRSEKHIPQSPLSSVYSTQLSRSEKHIPQSPLSGDLNGRWSRSERCLMGSGQCTPQSCPIPRPLLPQIATKIILSIDGGGSRGIIPLYYAVELLNRLNVNRLPVDMIAGTSVGSLVGTALLLGRGRELLNDFQPIVKRIFKKNTCSFFGLFGPRYRADGRLEVIEGFLGNNGEEMIRNMGTGFLVPFCSSKTFYPFLYDNCDNVHTFSLLDALMASSAAPTYFPPHVFVGDDGTNYEGVDGGIFANHPGAIAYQRAQTRYYGCRIVMISIGTGICDSYEPCMRKGLLGWAKKFPALTLSVSSSSINRELVWLAHNVPSMFQYIRINPTLDRKDILTDCIKANYLDKLRTAAHHSIQEGGIVYEQFTAALNVLRMRLEKQL